MAWSAKTPDEVARAWSASEAAGRYATDRFRSPRAAARDPVLVAAILREWAPAGAPLAILDVPCGAGRLTPALAARARLCVGADVSAAMLGEARARASGTPRVLACAESLPFADGAFDAVVCCRLLHHLRDPAAAERVLRELVRVSRGLVIASFWDSASLPALRVRLGLKRAEPRRAPVSRAAIAGAFEDAGAELLGFRSTLRFVSQQTFAVARVRGARR